MVGDSGAITCRHQVMLTIIGAFTPKRPEFADSVIHGSKPSIWTVRPKYSFSEGTSGNGIHCSVSRSNYTAKRAAWAAFISSAKSINLAR